MKTLFLSTAVAAALLTAAADVAWADPCQTIAGASVPNTVITATQSVPAGTYQAPNGQSFAGMPAFCRVVAYVSTLPGEHVGIEVWLPTGWNGRFEGLGNGGFGGSIVYSALAAAVQQGYAAANTDTGHTGGSVGAIGQPLPWAQNHVQLVDWGHSSIHLMTESAKVIVKEFYGRAAKRAYYDGCSTGGAEAMEEAEFYPDDYDGIHAGSPGMDYSHLMMSFLWGALPSKKDPAAALPPSALTLLNDAVLAACQRDKAVASDGFLNDPRDCHFDPTALLCKPNQSPGTCLTAPQVAAVQQLYSAVRNPSTGMELYPGFVRGSEGQWSLIQGALVPFFAQPLLANTVFGDPNWDWTSFNFDSDAALVDAKLSPYINATSPDLDRFKRHGGKLIMTQGWADALNAQTLPIEYFNSVVAAGSGQGRGHWGGGLAETLDFFRLFMAPGMSHCGGGPGPNSFDAVSPLVDWVEHGVAPAAIVATKYVNDAPAQGVAMTRPLCPYPQVARYRGFGNTNDAGSFVCIDDRDDFVRDFTHELKNIEQDLRAGDLANLPN
jgi:feruloyl esterase